MPNYTLTYFDGRGLGEVSRWVFAVADKPYNDVRIPYIPGENPEWQKIKPSTPFGQVPVLEVDGVKICQSNTIANYLANEFGLAGKTNLDHARCSMIVDCLTDVAKGWYPVYQEKDETKKAELKAKFEEDLKTAMKHFEKFACDNGHGHFVGDSITLADIAFTVNMERLTGFQVDPHLDSFPKLKEINDKTRAHPKIVAWIAKRPVTQF